MRVKIMPLSTGSIDVLHSDVSDEQVTKTVALGEAIEVDLKPGEFVHIETTPIELDLEADGDHDQGAQ